MRNLVKKTTVIIKKFPKALSCYQLTKFQLPWENFCLLTLVRFSATVKWWQHHTGLLQGMCKLHIYHTRERYYHCTLSTHKDLRRSYNIPPRTVVKRNFAKSTYWVPTYPDSRMETSGNTKYIQKYNTVDGVEEKNWIIK